MLWQSMTSFFKSWFIFPGLDAFLVAIGVGLAILFGAIWLLAHWPPLFKKPWFWAVAVVSAFLTMLAITFLQIPAAYYIGKGMQHVWNQATLNKWLYLSGIPLVLITGIVQEGAKMVPLVFWWWRSGKTLDPKMGMAIGAIAGAGFGIFEAMWAHNQILFSGITLSSVFSSFSTIMPFWERFWAVALHISVSALVGYGLAKGKGWQFYLIAAGVHTVANYFIIPLRKGLMTTNEVEICAAGVAAILTLITLYLRWRKQEVTVDIQPAAPPELNN
jgi:RsiW-degrading membrane proteinase PrsW (M82 family)